MVSAKAMEASARGTLNIVKDVFDLGDGVFVQVIEPEKDRSLSGFELVVELEHHLAGPVIALDEPVALIVGRVASERPRDIGTGGTVVILD